MCTNTFAEGKNRIVMIEIDLPDFDGGFAVALRFAYDAVFGCLTFLEVPARED